MSVDEIMNGKEGGYIGVITFVKKYVETMNLEENILSVINKYINFISKRASGEYITPATWMRSFVTSHPEYKNDSVVTHSINYDLLEACNQLATGKLEIPEMLPPLEERKLPDGIYGF